MYSGLRRGKHHRQRARCLAVRSQLKIPIVVDFDLDLDPDLMGHSACAGERCHWQNAGCLEGSEAGLAVASGA